MLPSSKADLVLDFTFHRFGRGMQQENGSRNTYTPLPPRIHFGCGGLRVVALQHSQPVPCSLLQGALKVGSNSLLGALPLASSSPPVGRVWVLLGFVVDAKPRLPESPRHKAGTRWRGPNLPSAYHGVIRK